MTEKGFLAALKDFFGTNGNSTKEFAEEVKALTDQDKTDLYAMLAAQGIDCEPPRAQKPPDRRCDHGTRSHTSLPTAPLSRP